MIFELFIEVITLVSDVIKINFCGFIFYIKYVILINYLRVMLWHWSGYFMYYIQEKAELANNVTISNNTNMNNDTIMCNCFHNSLRVDVFVTVIYFFLIHGYFKSLIFWLVKGIYIRKIMSHNLLHLLTVQTSNICRTL